MFVLYGIKNCDTVKKARQFLEDHDIKFRFHDVRADGLSEQTVLGWAQGVSWEKLLNTRSKTWHGLNASEKQGLNEAKAAHLICQHPTVLKRPLLHTGKSIIVGFDEAVYQDIVDHA